MNIQSDVRLNGSAISADGPHNLHARIEQNKIQLAALYPLPHIPSLEAEVQRHTPKAVLGDVIAKSDLALAVMSLDEARAKLVTHAALDAERLRLQQELTKFEQDQRQARLDQADKQFARTLDAFGAQAESLCRTYRDLLETHTRLSRSVPGFQPRRLPGFNIPHLNGSWNDFTTAETMAMGPMSFEATKDAA